jgi:hypothetical protein
MATTIEELHHREGDGITVSLLWNRLTNTLSVRVYDSTNQEEFELDCAADEALDTFHHPFAYAATGRLKHRSSRQLTHT